MYKGASHSVSKKSWEMVQRCAIVSIKETYDKDLLKRPIKNINETYKRDLWKRPISKTYQKHLWDQQGGVES